MSPDAASRRVDKRVLVKALIVAAIPTMSAGHSLDEGKGLAERNRGWDEVPKHPWIEV